MGGEPEVISHGRDRDPWRPSRRLVAATCVVALVVAALAYGRDQVQARRADRAAEQRAVDEVAFDVEELSNGDLGWRLTNLSATGLTVNSAVLDFPHQDLLSGPQTVDPYGSLSLGHGTCDEGLYDHGPTSLVIQAKTRKGSRLSRRLTFDEGTRNGGWDEARRACRMLSPGESLVGEIATATWTGSTVDLVYGLNNVGALPLSLEGVEYEPGVTVTVLPRTLSLPASTTAAWGPLRRLRVQLRVSSCSKLEGALRAAAGGDGLDGWGTLKPQLRHAHGRGGGYLDLGGHALRLLRTCGNVASYLDATSGD